jgi:glycosyltransferase involved in cell wall biosynthesis
VLLAVRDAERYLGTAVASVLAQTVDDLELVVVDDASTDGSSRILVGIDDPRLVVLRNDEQLGLAGSLNRALEHARGRYLARLDADDVAMPGRLERQLGRIGDDRIGIVGSGVLEIDDRGRPGRIHLMPASPAEVRWHLLFSSPFFHPSVLVERELLERHELRYDPSFEESEDYDLWSRLLEHGDGANVEEPLVLYRVHAGQATRRRRDLQRSFQRRVALREIARVAPDLGEAEAELAWRLGADEPVDPPDRERAVEAFRVLLDRFERTRSRAERRAVRSAAARVLLRRGAGAVALALDPALPLTAARRRMRRRRLAAAARAEARRALAPPSTDAPVRVTIVSPEPTPFRSLLFDRLALQPELQLQVLYSRRTIFSRTWTIVHRHPHRFLGGVAIPGVRRLLRHDYPLTLGVFRSLSETRPQVVVVSGWSTFASQAAVVWCRLRKVPYVLLVESNDRDPRPGWRRIVKRLVVPPIIRRAARILAIGTLARESVLARGADPREVRWFANTVDVPAFFEHAEQLVPRRPELRAALGAGDDDVIVLSVARLAPEKGLDTLVRGVAAAGDPRLYVVVAGEGPERDELTALAADLGVRLSLLGDLQPWERVFDLYAAADVFALLSTHEPWGVVVNEAAAFGLPLVLSDRVGAAYDLLVDGENGALVAAGDARATGAALGRLADDAGHRLRAAARSKELMKSWGYEPSIENFVVTVREAAAA